MLTRYGGDGSAVGAGSSLVFLRCPANGVNFVWLFELSGFMEPLNGADCGVSFKRFDIMPTADVLSCFIGYALCKYDDIPESTLFGN